MKNEKLIKSLVNRAKKAQAQIEELKLVYGELDQLALQLEALGFKKGFGVELVDNFYCKNVSFKAVGIRRFELKFKGSKK